jgi:hypothetical protein
MNTDEHGLLPEKKYEQRKNGNLAQQNPSPRVDFCSRAIPEIPPAPLCKADPYP